eukprot:scaffold5138_cov125-Isochrysis_galbana.AAC.6
MGRAPHLRLGGGSDVDGRVGEGDSVAHRGRHAPLVLAVRDKDRAGGHHAAGAQHARVGPVAEADDGALSAQRNLGGCLRGWGSARRVGRSQHTCLGASRGVRRATV